MNKQHIVNTVLNNRNRTAVVSNVSAFASSNIALCKYWGKRNAELNLPITSSLSISLGTLGTETNLTTDCEDDRLDVNGVILSQESDFFKRVFQFIDLFREPEQPIFVKTSVNIPIGAGLASSASGFAALVKSLNQMFDWQLTKKELSILSRMGSGSSSRSFWSGFVEWAAGEQFDGMDSYASPIETPWTSLRVGLVICATGQKPISSTKAMKITAETSPFYPSWPLVHSNDLKALKQAILDQNFVQLGEVSERNALAMHALMVSANPPICYSLPETIRYMHRVWELRGQGLPIYFTQDAGPNLKLLFLEDDQSNVLSWFPEAEIVNPFEGGNE